LPIPSLAYTGDDFLTRAKTAIVSVNVARDITIGVSLISLNVSINGFTPMI